MNSILYSIVLLACFASCASRSLQRNWDWSPDWNWRWNPKKQPRNPPPPFDVPRLYPRPLFPTSQTTLQKRNSASTGESNVPMTTTPQSPSNTTNGGAIVLYELRCNPCMAGWGVKSMCSNKSDTVCTPCTNRTWSPRTHHYRPCMPCSKCGDGLYELQSCTSSRDTVCASCSSINALPNEDFLRKCSGWFGAGSKESDMDLFDIEVIELKSKELLSDLDRSDADDYDDDSSMEVWGWPESGAEHEFDITIDDPDIESDLPETKKDKLSDYMSKDDEEWARFMEERSLAREEMMEESKEINEASIKPLQDDANRSDKSGTDRPRFHPIRPLPRRVPQPEKNIRVELDDTGEPSVENNFPPSYHEYPVSALIHAGDTQQRKAIVLLVLTCAVVLATIAFVICYIKDYCRKRSTLYSGVAVVNLTPEERDIIRKSAHVLEAMEKPTKKSRASNTGYCPVADEKSHTAAGVAENPLEAYLNSIDEGELARKDLIENEVSDDSPARRM